MSRNSDAVRKWKLKNPDKVKEAKAAWYRKHKEEIAEKDRLAGWSRVNGVNRRARVRNCGGRIPVGYDKVLFILQKGKCPCCRKELGDDYHIDHIIPLALGGDNSKGNFQLLRKQCNQKKYAKHPVDYMQSKGFLL